MAPPALRVKGEKMRGQLRDNDGKIVIATDGSLSFSDDDNLSIRSMDSSRDEMFNSPFVNRPKPTAKYPLRLEVSNFEDFYVMPMLECMQSI